MDPALLPPAFAEMLHAAIAEEEREGRGRDAVLRRHYFELMPAMRAEQLDARREPQASFMHARLALGRMPRLARALERLADLLRRCEVPGDPAERFASSPTLAEIYAESYYGGFMPMLHAYPADLAACAREAERDDVATVVDRRLTAPLVHELSHFGRGRTALLPLYLDECIAAHLGVLVLPELAYPAPGEDNGIYATPWLSQVGQALARLVGLAPLVRAQAGVAEWDDVLPPGFRDEAWRAGWADYLQHRGPHLLSNNFAPAPWLALIARHGELDGPEPPEMDGDEEVLCDGLRAMCLHNELVGACYRTSTRPPRAPVRIDVAARTMSVPGGPCDPVPLAYPVPAALARRWQAAGITEHVVEIADVTAIPDIARVLRAGA